MEDRREASIQNTMVYPSGPRTCPVIPVSMASGINTTQVVTVDAATEALTRFVPSSASFIYSTSPPARSAVVRKQLSRTTMELSTIIPTPSVRALKVMMFIVIPMAFMAIRDTRIDTGIELPTISEARSSPKNSQMMIMEITMAMTMVSATDSREETILSALSSTIVMVRSGSSRISVSMTSFTESDRDTADALCCLEIPRETVSLPL